jgi:hypothetical protein
MKRNTSPMLCTINAKRSDTKRELLICSGIIAFCTIWLTLEFFTKLADSL